MRLLVVILISKAIAKNPKIWRCIDKKIYNVIFVSPKALLGFWSWFWQYTIRNKKNKF